MFNVRGAHSAFSIYGVTYCESNTGCPRINFLRQHGIESTPDDSSQKTWALGRANEEVAAHYLDKLGRVYVKEMEITYQITENVSFCGHEDFVLIDGPVKEPWEIKSVSSTKQYEKIFINGMYKYDNLCQLLAYMIGLNVFIGILRYTNYVWHSNKSKTDPWRARPCDRIFVIEVMEDGEVTVDSAAAGINVQYIRDHQLMCAQMLETENFCISRPRDPRERTNDYVTPCGYCPFKLLCDKYDTGTLKSLADIKDFVSSSIVCSIGGR